jgi:hypothetical protein
VRGAQLVIIPELQIKRMYRSVKNQPSINRSNTIPTTMADESIGGTGVLGSLPSLPPLPMVAQYVYIPLTCQQQEGEAIYEDETMTAVAGIEGKDNWRLKAWR